MIQIECRKCGAKHLRKNLRKTLVCCSTSRGARYLIVHVRDPATGEDWFTATNAAVIRDFVKGPLP